MKKIALIALIVFSLASCKSEESKVEKIMENGVEIIVNHLEPYKIEKVAPQFALQEDFSINMDSDELLDAGLAEVHSFDVDSEGNIYIISVNIEGNLIYKFNNQGKFLQSFGRSGQGPGEFVDCAYFRISSRNELIVAANNKIIFFDIDGSFMQETKITLGTSSGTLLDNGNYLFKDSPRPSKEKSGEMVSSISLYNPEFVKIKELDQIKFPDPGSQDIKGIYYKLFWDISNDMIFTASQDRDYEIYVYDLNGNFVRKIRKKHEKTPPSDEYKNKYIKNLGENMYRFLKDRLYFPSSLPFFHYFITDNNGSLFVMTYEVGLKPGEHIYDVFNPDGVFILKESMKACLSNDFLTFSSVDFVDGKIKNDRFYCHYEKEDGTTNLLVYKISWSGL